jgi:hypothetical protein
MEGINNYSCADYALFLKRHTLRQAQQLSYYELSTIGV